MFAVQNKAEYPVHFIKAHPLVVEIIHCSSVTSYESIIDDLRISTGNHLRLVNSNVKKTLHVSINRLHVFNTTIGTVLKCKILRNAEVSSTQISSLGPHAVFVERQANLLLTDLSIDEVKEGGLIVEGSLVMRNVVIMRLERHGIILGRNARTVIFENVVIEHGPHDGIVNLGAEEATVTNLTLSGKSLTSLDGLFKGDPVLKISRREAAN